MLKRIIILLAAMAATPAFAGEYTLVIDEQNVNFTGKARTALSVNGSIPGPLLRWREGEEVTIHVRNRLSTTSSIHWHGIILPQSMDGVPGLSFNGIAPGETFTYRFTVRQSGTYWYHSHSALQEQSGVYGPIVIDPAGGEPYRYDREYVVMLSDWTDEDPHRVLGKLKKHSDYYNFRQGTVGDFFRDAGQRGWRAAWRERMDWGKMRMTPTDIADVTGYTYTYLLNGSDAQANWTGLFKAGERVRLRFINGSAMTYFDVRIPGLPMTVVQADGQNVQPVPVDEFRIAVAETYDVIVEPKGDQAYTIFAETIDRSGYARGTLAPRQGMSAPLPPLREPPQLTMKDMGMDHSAMGGGHNGHDINPMPEAEAESHGEHGAAAMDMPTVATGAMEVTVHGGMDPASHAGHGTGAAPATMSHGEDAGGTASASPPWTHGPDRHGPMNSMVARTAVHRLHEPGIGLDDVEGRVLRYTDLRSVNPGPDQRPPRRDIELHLTGSMERYIWSFDGVKFSDSAPIRLEHNERVRVTLVNDTMMNHPIHLHGMWSELDNGAGPHKPRKHTINVKPGERLSFEVTADALGEWAFHCHLLYHMDTGMMRTVDVAESHKETH